jgi:hypothetical protein
MNEVVWVLATVGYLIGGWITTMVMGWYEGRYGYGWEPSPGESIFILALWPLIAAGGVLWLISAGFNRSVRWATEKGAKRQ